MNIYFLCYRFVRRGFSECSIASIPEKKRRKINLSRKSKYYMKKLLPDRSGITVDRAIIWVAILQLGKSPIVNQKEKVYCRYHILLCQNFGVLRFIKLAYSPVEAYLASFQIVLGYLPFLDAWKLANFRQCFRKKDGCKCLNPHPNGGLLTSWLMFQYI